MTNNFGGNLRTHFIDLIVRFSISFIHAQFCKGLNLLVRLIYQLVITYVKYTMENSLNFSIIHSDSSCLIQFCHYLRPPAESIRKIIVELLFVVGKVRHVPRTFTLSLDGCSVTYMHRKSKYAVLCEQSTVSSGEGKSH